MAQGFKVVIRDIGLHMSNRVTDYSNEDVGLCRGALEARRGPLVAPTNTEFSSVQEFLESSHFVQVSLSNESPRALQGPDQPLDNGYQDKLSARGTEVRIRGVRNNSLRA